MTTGNLVAARAALSQRLPVTPELLKELTAVLSTLILWGQTEAELAAAMKAAGLPLTPGSLALALRAGAQTGDSLAQLIARLQTAAGSDLSEDVRAMLASNLQALEEIVVKWENSPGQLSQQIEHSVEILGRSLENILKEQAQGTNPFWPEKSLMSLVRLQQLLERAGEKELAQVINRFLDDVRQNQLVNIKPDPVPGRGEWSETGFMLQTTFPGQEEAYVPARLRIAHEAGAQSGKINPDYTRLILQVDLQEGETVQVDLSLVGRNIRAALTAPDPVWCQNAREELPALEEALTALGYQLKNTQIGVGYPRSFHNIVIHPSNTALMAVDIEV